jgi:hypothetical protein
MGKSWGELVIPTHFRDPDGSHSTVNVAWIVIGYWGLTTWA